MEGIGTKGWMGEILGVPAMSILNPGMRVFPENLQKPRLKTDQVFEKNEDCKEWGINPWMDGRLAGSSFCRELETPVFGWFQRESEQRTVAPCLAVW